MIRAGRAGDRSKKQHSDRSDTEDYTPSLRGMIDRQASFPAVWYL